MHFLHIRLQGQFIKKIPLEPNVQYPTMNFVDDYIIHYPGNANITGLYANVYVQDWMAMSYRKAYTNFPGSLLKTCG